jgi:ketosteroid isomerase-like protein
MRIAHGWFLLLAIFTGSAQAAFPQDAQQSRIVTLENAWNQALQQKDVKALDPLLAGELVYIEYDGTLMTKAQYLFSVSAPRIHFEHIVSESMQVLSYGQSAVVVGVYREKGLKNGKPYLHHERFVDTWINRNGTWICVASQSTLLLH